jgi:zinc and cadmium transporter
VLGGVVGYFLLDHVQGALPYALALAAASFIYIALSDLLPEMMRRTSLRRTLPEVGLVLLGVALAVAMTEFLHGH